MKKVVNSVLASALALTVAPMVVGAEEATAPKMDPALEKTVKRLEALGLVQGYGNGDFGVERAINRAEFATLVVRARGLEEGAKLAQFQSNFTDVKPADWFAGYVNVASGQEIVKGYTDNTFKAGNNVTYAEAAAMIVRALGYDQSVKGVWPNNYIAKASELSISKGVKIVPDKPATRGDVFMMLDNALSVDLMKQTEYGTDIRFEILEGKTLLTEFLDVKVYDMKWARNNKGKDTDDLPFVSKAPVVDLGSLKVNEVGFTGDSLVGTYKVADGINPNDYLGQHVQVWVKDDRDDIVVWMEGSEDEEVVDARIDTFFVDGKKAMDDKADLIKKIDKNLELKLSNDKTYQFAEDAVVMYNYERRGKGSDAVAALKEVAKHDEEFRVKVVLNNDDDIAYIAIVDDVTDNSSSKENKYGSKVIEKIDDNKKKITNLDGGSFDSLKDKEEGKDFLVFINGKPGNFADIKPLDVYDVYYADGNSKKPLLFVTSKTVEGTVDAVQSRTKDDKGTGNRLEINGTTYRFTDNATYSENGNKDVSVITRDEALDLDGVEVKVYLDAHGYIRHIETKEDVNTRRYKGIITKGVTYDNRADQYAFVALSEKGVKETVAVDAEDIVWGYDPDGNGPKKKGDELTESEIEKYLNTIDANKTKNSLNLVEVTKDSKGNIDQVKILDTTGLKMLKDDEWEKAADEDGDLLNTKDGSYDVTDSTVVFDMTGEVKTQQSRRELKDAKVAKFKSVADDDDVTVYYLVDEEDAELDYVFVVEGSAIESESNYGLVTKVYTSKGDDMVDILQKDGNDAKVVSYKMDGSTKKALDKFDRFDFIRFSLNADNEFIINDAVEVMDSQKDDPEDTRILPENQWKKAKLDKVVAVEVKKVDKNTITPTAGKAIYTSASTIFYNVTDLETTSGVEDGDFIVAVDTDDDDTRMDYVLIVADEDRVEEEDLDMTDFLKQTKLPENPGPTDDFIDNDTVVGTEKSFLGSATSFVYTVEGQLTEDGIDGEVTITVDGKDYVLEAADIEEDGYFKYVLEGIYPAGTYKTFKVTVTVGDKSEVVNGSFEK